MSGSTWTILCMVVVYVLVSQSRLVHCLDNHIDTENGELQNDDNKQQELNKAQEKHDEKLDNLKAPLKTNNDEDSENDKENHHVAPEQVSEINTNLGFMHAFIAALSVIIVSEIGDKTFFIAAILAMKHSRLIVFGGALSALGCMTVLSVLLGSLTVIIPRWVTFYVCTLLLALFGLKMLYEAWNMSPSGGQEEFEEVSAELKKKENILNPSSDNDIEQGKLTTKPPLRRRFWFLSCFTPIFIQAFTLTFLAEWGDRSQLTTIILSARENPVGVTLGGTLGHALCTALAVLGGKIISERISVRTVTFIGGIVFLVFVVTALLDHDV